MDHHSRPTVGLCLWCYGSPRGGAVSYVAEPVDAYLTKCVYSSILDSQVPRKNVNLLFTLNNSDRELTVLGGGVTL